MKIQRWWEHKYLGVLSSSNDPFRRGQQQCAEAATGAMCSLAGNYRNFDRHVDLQPELFKAGVVHETLNSCEACGNTVAREAEI